MPELMMVSFENLLYVRKASEYRNKIKILLQEYLQQNEGVCQSLMPY